MRWSSSALWVALGLCLASQVNGFVTSPHATQRQPFLTTLFAEADSSYLLNEFRLYNGELVDPYNVLKVSRKAERSDIRKKYIDLSRRYHPDAAMHRDILPGSCNNEDDVRMQWEKIKLSYEILSNRKMRTRYDRNVVIADPQAAMKRAAVEAAGGAAVGVASYVGKGVFAVGKGIFSMGAKAVASATNGKNDKGNKESDVKV